jgi:hypothetical protein
MCRNSNPPLTILATLVGEGDNSEYSIRFHSDLRPGPGDREWQRALPARAISQPIQTDHVFLGVAQPGRNLFRLKRLISRAEVAIEQLCDLGSRGRPLDLVQGSQHMLVEVAFRMGNLAHLRFSGLKADLLKVAH